MTVATADAAEAPKPRSKILLIAIVLALMLGGGAFYAVFAGLVPLPFGGEAAQDAGAADGHAAPADGDAHAADPHLDPPAILGAPAFVALEPLVITLGPTAHARHLKLVVQLETGAERAAEVEALRPRVRDVLNTFLRAVDEREFEVPRAMPRLRAQMLRRVQLVTPEGSVRDVLIQEFVLN